LGWIAAGFTRGMIWTVRQSRYTISTIRRKNISGNQVRAQCAAVSIHSPTGGIESPIGSAPSNL
jgi:hypothetical protein